MNRKSKLVTLATMLLLVMLVGPVFFVQTAQAWVDPAAWYKTVSGVLATDYYTLYPYETDKSLKIGFSQFGEMIDSINNVGLEYRNVDPFAPAAGPGVLAAIPKKNWINGWLINITFTGLDGKTRCVWASATHADFKDYGGPWLRVDFAGDVGENPMAQGYQIGNYAGGLKWGGRKTNGTAVTMPIEVLYHGPRKFVALLNTTIYDHPVYLTDDPLVDIPLVRILFTIIFDKVKKSVVILKDVKSIAPKLILLGRMKVQFSNRGEIDLGTEALGFPSYAHFYTAGAVPTEGQPTVYDRAWEDLVITRAPDADTLSGRYPQTAPATFDVAQIINTDTENVFFAAFWPSLSDWSIFGGALWWRSLVAADPHYVDIPLIPGEPHPTPFYIGEWDFELTDMLGKELEFRGVTVYGVTDLHDGSDDDMDGVRGEPLENVIDKEARFQLDEVFNPWDLLDAVKKANSRYVKFVPGPITTETLIPLTPPPVQTLWDEYCSFAERVILLPDGVLWERGVDYTLGATGITTTTAVPSGKTLKILWSSSGGRYEWIVVGRDSAAVDSAGAAMVSEAFNSKVIPVNMSGLDMQDMIWGPRVPYVMSWLRTNVAPELDKVQVRADPASLQPSRAHYRDAAFGPCSGRSALLDDWCTKVPISSSNIITIGSSWANHATEYWNEFTDAYLDVGTGESLYPSYIVSLSCWSKNKYKPTFVDGWQPYGYAVISTYKDLNGTIGFAIWGWTGQDSYYACKWFWDEGITQLQGFPGGVTAIILKFNYGTAAAPKCPPSFSVVECLGTISETLVDEVKGGIHVDP